MRTIATTLFLASVGCQSGGDQASLNTQTGTQTNQTVAANATTASNNTTVNQTTSTNALGCGSAGEVTLNTSDDVALVADFQPAQTAGRGAVLLFHMIPPGNDRSSYPVRVRQALNDLDLNVLNVDRRGAGASGGTARDAYEGDKTSLDVEAAVKFLQAAERACAVDTTRLMLVGASNGTTSVFDYTVGRVDTALPAPASMVWLSPGTYTEAQNTVADHRPQLDALPLLIVHPDSEPWATQFDAALPAQWKVVEVAGGQHGTRNFDDGALEALVLPELVDWARATVGPR